MERRITREKIPLQRVLIVALDLALLMISPLIE